jgi:GNAT superfamily N-acetyltransferase
MANHISVQPATTRQDIEEFMRFPFRLYRDDPNWVPPLLSERRAYLDAKRNPFFQHATVTLWLARQNGRVVGTISGHIDHLHNQVHDEKIGMFGFLETVNDFAVAEALLLTARDWVRSQGMSALRGPLSFSTNAEVGLLIDGTPGPPMVLMPYNPPYYGEFLARFGLAKVMDVYAYVADLAQFHGKADNLPEKLVRVTERMKQRAGLVTRTANMKDFDQELQRAKIVYNQAWQQNWGFVPMTDAEIEKMAEDLKQIIDPKLAVFVEADGQPVGVSVCLPDANQVLKHLKGRLFPVGWAKALWYSRKVDSARLMILGVTEAYRGRGVEAVLMFETVRSAILNGYTTVEFSWILETNEMMNRIIENVGGPYGAHIYRTYRIYQLAV